MKTEKYDFILSNLYMLLYVACIFIFSMYLLADCLPIYILWNTFIKVHCLEFISIKVDFNEGSLIVTWKMWPQSHQAYLSFQAWWMMLPHTNMIESTWSENAL